MPNQMHHRSRVRSSVVFRKIWICPWQGTREAFKALTSLFPSHLGAECNIQTPTFPLNLEEEENKKDRTSFLSTFFFFFFCII